MSFSLRGMFKKPAGGEVCPYQAYVQEKIILPREVRPQPMSVRFASVQPPLHRSQPAPDYDIAPPAQKISTSGRISLLAGTMSFMGVLPG